MFDVLALNSRMIHNVPIVNVEIEYTEDAVSAVHVKFIDQFEASYDSATDIAEVFQRIAEQQKMVEENPSGYGVDTQGTSA